MYMYPKYHGNESKEGGKPIMFAQRNLPTKVEQLVKDAKEV